MKDVIIIGAGPIGLACGIEAEKKGLDYLIFDKGCLVNSLYNYPLNMTFFSTSDKLEIGEVPFISHNSKPTRAEALEYYRRVASQWKLNLKLYESINNAFFQGIGLILMTKLASQLDFFMVMFWTIFYVTVHNINFNLKSSWIHRDHHKKTLTNIGFGFEFFDIVFGTGRQTESRPDMAINVIVITVVLYYLVPYFKNKD